VALLLLGTLFIETRPLAQGGTGTLATHKGSLLLVIKIKNLIDKNLAKNYK
jgi:hypothetical protein